MEEHSLAFEMLQEIKKSNKRWFSIAVIELGIITILCLVFFAYTYQFDYESEIYQYVEDTEMESSILDQSIGE